MLEAKLSMVGLALPLALLQVFAYFGISMFRSFHMYGKCYRVAVKGDMGRSVVCN